MTIVDVPKFMNALISDLQSDAWDRDVKLVLDASTPMAAALEQASCQRALSSLLGALIRVSQVDSSISVISEFEPNAAVAAEGTMQLTITATTHRSKDIEPSLVLLRDVAKAHQGQVVVTAEEASWTCTLTVPKAVLSQASATSLTAVVVDDDVDMQDFLRAVLESRGFKVIAVNDGFDALIVIDRYQPDVVLTDVLMPNMNGIDLVGRIKKARSDLPVIVFSGYYDSLVKKSAQFGSLPDYVLPKPMTQLQVITAIDTVLTPKASAL